MQIDDIIHSVKLLGTSWLVHVAYTANELTALHLNGWLGLTRAGVTKFGPGGPVSLQSLAPTLIKHTWSS